MAASAIDESVRNCVAVGADPDRIAILDNFCWGNTERAETLGTLVRAAVACQDIAIAYGTPFVSGKDSLNNEFSYEDASGSRRTVAIPSTLLITALGQVADVETCVTMDLKEVGNTLYLIGETKNEMGGSHFHMIHGLIGGQVPQVDVKKAPGIFRALHQCIRSGLIRACHDLSEGGLAVSIAEMAFAGGIGARVQIPETGLSTAVALFSESNTRFVIEVEPKHVAQVEQTFNGISMVKLGETIPEQLLEITNSQSTPVIKSPLNTLKSAWQKPLQ